MPRFSPRAPTLAVLSIMVALVGGGLAGPLPATVPAPRAAAPPAPSGDRPVILLVHGRGLQGSDTTVLRRSWGVALEDAIRGVAGRGLLERDDVRLVWYADAVEGAATASCREGERARSPRATGWARDIGSTLEATGTLMGLAADLIGGREGEALDALAGDLLYLGDEGRRCTAGERLAEALAAASREGRPVVLVTHSFGALVAYDHLRTRDADAPRVERWVTVGSLLGHPELREILLAGGGGRGLPEGVGSWVNVRDPRDPLSAPLVGLRGEDDPTDAIQDRVTETRPDGDPHDMARYLADPATARAVLEGWRERGGASALPNRSRPRSPS